MKRVAETKRNRYRWLSMVAKHGGKFIWTPTVVVMPPMVFAGVLDYRYNTHTASFARPTPRY